MSNPWTLPREVVSKILKVAGPHIQLALEVRFESLRSKGHLITLLERQLQDPCGTAALKLELLTRIERLFDAIVKERHEMLRMLTIVAKT